MGLEPDASGEARVRMELGVRIVRTAFINTKRLSGNKVFIREDLMSYARQG